MPKLLKARVMSAVHNSWYVQIDGQVYGPYSHALMTDYVREGRIVAGSMITADPANGFVVADRYPQFKDWQGAQAQTQAAELAQPPAEMETPQKMAVGAGMARPAQQPQMRAQIQQAAPQIQPTAVHTAQPLTQPSAQPHTKASVFVVMAEIRSGQAMGFLQAIQSFGTAQRIGDTVWLVKGAGSAQSLRNTLSQTLTKQDRLFIVDSFSNETAWFNIGADMDSRIRALWSPQA